jgi:hypothetical protein
MTFCSVAMPRGSRAFQMLQHKSAEAVRQIIDNTSDVSVADLWDEPDLGILEADTAAPPAFDKDMLPPSVAEWCAGTAEAKGCPIDYVVGSLITSSSAWLGNARRVRVTPDWIEPSHAWVCLIGAPSSGKTPAMRPFIEMSKMLEAEAAPAWEETTRGHLRNTEIAKVRLDKFKDEIREAADRNVEPPPMPADAVIPDSPIRPRVLIADATIQEIGNVLKGNQRGLLMVRDELSGWLGDLDRYGGAGGDRAFYLETWNGGTHTIDRVKTTGKETQLEFASLALLGGLQPDKLKDALSGADDGLASRFIFIFPNSIPFRPLSYEHSERAEARHEKLKAAARNLHSLKMTEREDGSLAPVYVPLHPDARLLFDKAREKADRQTRAAHGLAAGWYGKSDARILRLALTFEFLNWAMSGGPEPTQVSGEAVAWAASYLDYAAGMMERALAGLCVTKSESDAALIAQYLKRSRADIERHPKHPGEVNERELYQSPGLTFLRDKQARVAAFQALVEAKLIRKPPHTRKGRPPGNWEINPRIWGSR